MNIASWSFNSFDMFVKAFAAVVVGVREALRRLLVKPHWDQAPFPQTFSLEQSCVYAVQSFFGPFLHNCTHTPNSSFLC